MIYSILIFLEKSRSTRRAMGVCLILVTAAIFQGLVVVQVYAEPLFEEAIPSISPTVCSVLLAVATVLASFGAAYFSEAAGRRVRFLKFCYPSIFKICFLTFSDYSRSLIERLNCRVVTVAYKYNWVLYY